MQVLQKHNEDSMSIEQIEKAFTLIGTLEHEIGKLLSSMKQSKEYRILGNHVQTWKEALKELGLTYSKAQSLIDAYETFPDIDNTSNYDRIKEISRLFKFGFIKKESRYLYSATG